MTLADVLNDAGGAPRWQLHSTSSPIERIQPNQRAGNDKPGTSGLQHAREPRFMRLWAFQVKDGDRIRVTPLLPHSDTRHLYRGTCRSPRQVSLSRRHASLTMLIALTRDLSARGPPIKGEI